MAAIFFLGLNVLMCWTWDLNIHFRSVALLSSGVGYLFCGLPGSVSKQWERVQRQAKTFVANQLRSHKAMAV